MLGNINKKLIVNTLEIKKYVFDEGGKILGKIIVEREIIIYYIKSKLNINREKYSNEDICNYLKRILNNNI